MSADDKPTPLKQAKPVDNPKAANKSGQNKRVKTNKKGNRDKKSTPVASPVSSPVEVEYQEKSPVQINTSEKQIDLRAPVGRSDQFESKDKSADGFLAIKH